MSADETPLHDTAARLLDAHVAWEVARLLDGGPDGTQDEALAGDVDLLLDLVGPLALGEVVEAATLSAAVVDVLGTVPASPGATRTVTSFATALAQHTPEARLHELISREHLEELTRRALGRADAIEAVLERLTDSPVTVRVAGGLVGRLVTEVLQANRAIAERIPGVGSLMSLGATAAGRVLGSAERPFEHLLSETAGKGATFAMRRLNRVLVDTLRDPDALAAVLEVYDLHADSVLPRPDGTPEEVDDVLQLVHDAVAAGLGSAPMGELVGVLVAGVLRDHGDRPVADVLDDLGLTRDELVVHAITLAPRALAAAHASGRLEEAVRARLRPFYASSGFSEALEA